MGLASGELIPAAAKKLVRATDLRRSAFLLASIRLGNGPSDTGAGQIAGHPACAY
jgi:hypothetical protein